MKLLLLGGALTLLALAFAQVFTWWYGPWQAIQGRMEPGQAYEVTGIVFAARTLFGFSLGVLLGTLIRRTVPAMAATAAVWLAIAWPSVVYLRPLIQKPAVAAEGKASEPSGWIFSSWLQDPAGHHVSMRTLLAQMRDQGVLSRDGVEQWLADHHYQWWDKYQPAGRFWHFQFVESGCYVALAVLFGAGTLWWLHRRAA